LFEMPQYLLRILIFASFLMPPFYAAGQVAQWTFENINNAVPSLPISPSSTAMGASGSARLGPASGSSNNGSVDACNGNETWTTNLWPNSTERVTDDYIQFRVNVSEGTFEITHFSFISNISSSNSATSYDVYYSTDGFTTETFLDSGNHSTGSCTAHGGNLEEELSAGESILFRIYPYNQGAGTASLRIDDVTVSGSLLPIELISFEARPEADRIQLSWNTAVEINNEYMAVERSTDGNDFSEIGRVSGAGTTHEPQQYFFQDRQPVTGTNYYRLRQVDHDGTTSYHQIIAVEFSDDDRGTDPVLVYPTLVDQSLRWKFLHGLGGETPYQIFNVSGQLMAAGLLTGNKGEISLSNLTSGTYFLRLFRPNQVLTYRFIKR
jgi:hypothetical protein